MCILKEDHKHYCRLCEAFWLCHDKCDHQEVDPKLTHSMSHDKICFMHQHEMDKKSCLEYE